MTDKPLYYYTVTLTRTVYQTVTMEEVEATSHEQAREHALALCAKHSSNLETVVDVSYNDSQCEVESVMTRSEAAAADIAEAEREIASAEKAGANYMAQIWRIKLERLKSLEPYTDEIK